MIPNTLKMDLDPEVMKFINNINLDVEYLVQEKGEEERKKLIDEIHDLRSIRPTVAQIPTWKNAIISKINSKKEILTTVLDREFTKIAKEPIDIWNSEYSYQKMAEKAIENRVNTSIIETFISEVLEASFMVLYQRYHQVLDYIATNHPTVFQEIIIMDKETVEADSQELNKEEIPIGLPVPIGIIERGSSDLTESTMKESPRRGELTEKLPSIYSSGVRDINEICLKLGVISSSRNKKKIKEMIWHLKKDGKILNDTPIQESNSKAEQELKTNSN